MQLHKGRRTMLLAATVVIEGVQDMAVPPASSTSECQCHKLRMALSGCTLRQARQVLSWLHAAPGPASAELLQRSWAVRLLRDRGDSAVAVALALGTCAWLAQVWACHSDSLLNVATPIVNDVCEVALPACAV